MTNIYDIYSLGIMVAVISFLGFCLENLWLAATKGFIDNRNMHLPFLMGYGVLVVGMYLILGTPEHMALTGLIYVNGTKAQKFLIYFLCSMVIVTVGELVHIYPHKHRLCRNNHLIYGCLLRPHYERYRNDKHSGYKASFHNAYSDADRRPYRKLPSDEKEARS